MKPKVKEWLKRYIPAEILGTAFSVVAATIAFSQTHNYITATASGWFFEGVGFYGYFVSLELFANSKRYKQYHFFKRVSLAIGVASTNLLVEFLPAEILDNFIIRPFLMYEGPHIVQPYFLGFLLGKLASDVLFYALAIIGYEARKRYLKR